MVQYTLWHLWLGKSSSGNDMEIRVNLMWGIMLDSFSMYYLFYCFIIYSFVGWIYESVLVSIKSKAFINRGFLNGPLIPIYGVGATSVFLCLHLYQNRPILVFILGMMIATILEYITSCLLEKVFHATWWDYNKFRFNFQGRICLPVSLFWGILSVLMMEIFQPNVSILIDRIPRKYGELLGYSIMLLVVVDLIITVVCTIHLERILTAMQKLREDITQYIESTRIYGTKEEVMSKLSNLKLTDMIGSFRNTIEERVEPLKRSERREEASADASVDELESRFRTFILKYQSAINATKAINKRILKAFPNYRSIDHEYPLKDLKDKIFKKNKKNKNK